MKKIIVILCLTIMIILLKDKSIIIPKESIRFRIIANSNTKIDQQIKTNLKNNIEQDVVNIISEAKTKNEANILINKNLKNIDLTIKNYLSENNIDTTYSINYGKNYFPKKEYRGINYKEGYYDSLVVTLGNGKGNNWWCVLFPPLCLIEGKKEQINQVKYKTLIKELIDYFNK